MARRFQEITEVYRRRSPHWPAQTGGGISALCLPEL